MSAEELTDEDKADATPVPPRTPVEPVETRPRTPVQQDVHADRCFVTRVTTKTGETHGKPWTVYVVTLSDSRQAATFDDRLAHLAEECALHRTPVFVELTPGKKAGTYRIVTLSGAIEDDPRS